MEEKWGDKVQGHDFQAVWIGVYWNAFRNEMHKTLYLYETYVQLNKYYRILGQLEINNIIFATRCISSGKICHMLPIFEIFFNVKDLEELIFLVFRYFPDDNKILASSI